MKKISSSILLFFYAITCFAQQGNSCPEDLFPYFDKEKRMWGYADVMGMPVIEPIFTKVSPYSANKAIVQKGDLCGVIDCNGNLIVPVVYQKIQNFRYDKAWVLKGNKWGLIDGKGRTALAAVYDEVRPVEHTELTWLRKDTLWGLYDESKLKMMCSFQYTMIQPMSQHCTLVEKNNLFSVLNHVDCGQLIQGDINKVKKVTARTVLFEQENKWGAFSTEGKLLIPSIYDTLYLAKDGILAASKDRKMGLIYTNGTSVTKLEYDSIYPFSSILFRVKKDNKYGYITSFGKVQIPIQYQDADDFYHGVAKVKTPTGYNLITFKDSFILPQSFKKIDVIKEYPIYVAQNKDGNLKLISTVGLNNIYVSENCQSFFVDDVQSDVIRIQLENSKMEWYNIKNGKYSVAFDSLCFLESNRFVYRQNQQYGLGYINDLNTLQYTSIIPAEMDKIESDVIGQQLIYYVTKNNLTGVYSLEGKTILPIQYSTVKVSGTNFILAQNNQWFVQKFSGQKINTVAFDYIDTIQNYGSWMTKRDGKWIILNDKGVESPPIKTKKLSPLGYGWYSAFDGKTYRLCNKDGVLQKVKYDSLSLFKDGMLAVQSKGLWGFVDTNGDVAIPCVYSTAWGYIYGRAIVKTKDGYIVIDKKGNAVNNEVYSSLILEKSDEILIPILIKNNIKYTIMPSGQIQKK
jgi:hypothetical protein